MEPKNSLVAERKVGYDIGVGVIERGAGECGEVVAGVIAADKVEDKAGVQQQTGGPIQIRHWRIPLTLLAKVIDCII